MTRSDSFFPIAIQAGKELLSVIFAILHAEGTLMLAAKVSSAMSVEGALIRQHLLAELGSLGIPWMQANNG